MQEKNSSSDLKAGEHPESDTLQAAVDYFQREPGLCRLLQLMAAKYRSLGRWGGSVTLTSPTEAEREGLAGFFRRDCSRQKSVTVSLERFAEAFKATKFAEVPVLELLSRVTGESLRTKADLMDERELQRQKFFAGLRAQFPQAYCQRWLDAIAGKDPGTRGIYPAYEKDPGQLQKHMQAVLRALADLEQRRVGPSWPDRKFIAGQSKPDQATGAGYLERLPLFAGRITQDPHGFDPDTEQGRLLLKAFTFLGQRNGGDLPGVSESEALNELYYKFGILRDDILNFVSCTGITAFKDDGVEIAVWQAANRDRVVLNVPLREIIKIKTAGARSGTKIYMVENSGVFSALLDRFERFVRELTPYPPLICAHGQFKLAGLVLLDRLVESGMTIYYSGDFDPEGLLMAERLCRRYPGHVVPWRYSVQDYQLAQSGTVIPPRRLSQLAGLGSRELRITGEKMLHCRTAGYQEAIIDLLWQDITGWMSW